MSFVRFWDNPSVRSEHVTWLFYRLNNLGAFVGQCIPQLVHIAAQMVLHAVKYIDRSQSIFISNT